MEQEENRMESLAPLPFTADEAEDELITLATNLALQRLRDGTASNQLVAEILKQGTAKARLEKEKLRMENEHLKAKTKAIESQRNTEEFQAKVLQALHMYAPSDYSFEDDDYE